MRSGGGRSRAELDSALSALLADDEVRESCFSLVPEASAVAVTAAVMACRDGAMATEFRLIHFLVFASVMRSPSSASRVRVILFWKAGADVEAMSALTILVMRKREKSFE